MFIEKTFKFFWKLKFLSGYQYLTFPLLSIITYRKTQKVKKYISYRHEKIAWKNGDNKQIFIQKFLFLGKSNISLTNYCLYSLKAKIQSV